LGDKKVKEEKGWCRKGQRGEGTGGRRKIEKGKEKGTGERGNETVYKG